MAVGNSDIARLVSALSTPEHAGTLATWHPSVRIDRERPPAGTRQAAVLILLSDGPNPDLTFVERAHTMRHHPGQIAFPGGALEPGESAVAAALREAHEEILLDPSHVEAHVTVPASTTHASFFEVAAVIGTWDGSVEIGIGNPGEVAAVHRFAAADLADPANRISATLPGGYHGPAFTMGEVFVWGFTANLVAHVLDLGGWSQPWDQSRHAAVPSRFLRDRNPGAPATWASDEH